MKYADYLKTEHWKNKRLEVLKDAGCEVCGKKEKLSVHHISYDNLWNETLNDLIVLCPYHHKRVHFSTTGKFHNNPKRNYGRVKSLKRHYELRKIIDSHDITENCSRCGLKPYKAYYQVWENGSKHYVVCCPKCGCHKQKRIDNLPIEVLGVRRDSKAVQSGTPLVATN